MPAILKQACQITGDKQERRKQGVGGTNAWSPKKIGAGQEVRCAGKQTFFESMGQLRLTSF